MSIAPKTPHLTAIYALESMTGELVKRGEEIFGFYKKTDSSQLPDIQVLKEKTLSVRDGDGQNAGRLVRYFDGEVTPKVIKDLTTLAARQDMMLLQTIKIIFETQSAFQSVSRADFSKAMVQAIQQPECAGFYAFNAMAHKVASEQRKIEERDPKYDKYLPDLVKSFGNLVVEERNGFLLSGEELRVGPFKSNPFTAEEIKAIPFLMRVLDPVYTAAGVNYSAHMKSVANKLASADFKTEANMIHKLDVNNHMQLKSKPAGRVLDDDGPSL